MENFMIICNESIVSRGTIKGRKTYIVEKFERLTNAQFMLCKLYNKYKKEMRNQLDEKIKSVNYKERHLVVTIDNGDLNGIQSLSYYIYERMM